MISSEKNHLRTPQLDISKPNDINYWSKKWEISAHQLLAAMINTKSTSINLIADYLKKPGFHNLPVNRN